MTIHPYGVLAARATGGHPERTGDTPHYQISLVDSTGAHYRAPVNVRSKEPPSEVLYLADDDFRHPVTGLLPAAGSGFKPLDSHAGTGALDYVRANLFDPSHMRPLPPDLPGVDNDLSDFLDHYVQRAVADQTIAVYVFGERFPRPGPAHGLRKLFARRHGAGQGVHDVHMNQGNLAPDFVPDDGVWQDGGLLFHVPAENRWVGVFLAFQSQAWHTDDTTGHALPAPHRVRAREVPLRIVGARFAAAGPGPDGESVTLLNASPQTLDLGGWRLTDGRGHLLPLPVRALAPGGTVAVPAGDGFRLGRDGGAVSLLDPAGLKVHGVAYTGEQARQEGWTTTFA
ncbi:MULTISPECIES: DUF2278 family protein [Streptomyces]|uniref:LTD domain-containing protein n=1 Tax=Streptomyces luteosporeus TaxID=173856 RepID=A0ABN3TK27_9ACTN